MTKQKKIRLEIILKSLRDYHYMGSEKLIPLCPCTDCIDSIKLSS